MITQGANEGGGLKLGSGCLSVGYHTISGSVVVMRSVWSRKHKETSQPIPPHDVTCKDTICNTSVTCNML